MVHVSELSWSRVDDPAQAVKVGEKIQVRILSVDTDSKSGQPRISLSAKQAQPDPWTQLEGRLETGQKITGTIVRHAPFGVFVEILPGVEGLVHISEMSYVRRVVDPTQEVKINDRVPVLVKAIDPDNRRISLSMKDAEGDPWLEVEERFKVGAVIRGTVEKREKFGIFVTLMPGVTGLLPGSRIAKSGKAKEIEALKPQDPIDVKIMEIDLQNRRIGLGPNEEGEMQKQDWQRFAPTKQQSSMGNLGQKLRQAMQAKDKKK
jgi:small subunit ribosomal protein S1